MMNDMAARDRKTRYQGVFARHQTGCRLEHGGQRCNCTPSFYGVVYDRAERKPVRTRRFPSVDMARNARRDLQAQLDRGETPTVARGLTLTQAREKFVAQAEAGVALNKRGQRYKPTAIRSIEQTVKQHAEPVLGRRRIGDIRRKDIQDIVDRMGVKQLSGSRIRTLVNGIRAIYTWAQDREQVYHDPAQRVKLPALNIQPEQRIVTPGQFAQLLGALDLEDQVFYGFAGYAWARAAQIQRVRWRDIDLNDGTVEWGVDWLAAKYAASHRGVPLLPPLLTLLKRLYIQQGRPAGEQLLFEPKQRRARNASGVVSTMGYANRATKSWTAAGLARITLKQARHSGITWLDAAGVSPRIASYLAGHAIPKQQAGAAPVTLQVYTHVLQSDVDRAVERIVAYLAEHERQRRDAR